MLHFGAFLQYFWFWAMRSILLQEIRYTMIVSIIVKLNLEKMLLPAGFGVTCDACLHLVMTALKLALEVSSFSHNFFPIPFFFLYLKEKNNYILIVERNNCENYKADHVIFFLKKILFRLYKGHNYPKRNIHDCF